LVRAASAWILAASIASSAAFTSAEILYLSISAAFASAASASA